MGKLVCPICSKLYDKLRTHVIRSHKLSWEDFILQYGDHPEFSEDFSAKMRYAGSQADREKIRQGLIRAFSTPSFKKKKAALTKRQWENPEFREMMAEVGRRTYREKLASHPAWVKTGDQNPLRRFLLEMHSGQHPEALQKMIAGRDAYNADPICAERLNEYWSDPKRIESARNRAKRNCRGVYTFYTRKDGSVIKMRSKTECRIANALDNLGIAWEYESLVVPYSYENKIHRHITDFYIPSHNLIVEVKPRLQWNDPKVLAKKEASVQQGYLYEFVGHPDDLEKIFGGSVTTIESIAKD